MDQSDLTVTKPAAGLVTYQYFGLMRMSGALLALPVFAIREVIPGRRTYSPLPVKAAGLLGAFDIRGAIIPLLDLHEVLGLPFDDGDEHVIVIMRWQGHLLGLRAREVSGIARLQASDLFGLATLGQDSSTMLAIHTFQVGDEIATLLDARAIAELPNVPLVAETTGNADRARATVTESILLFRYGRSHFGIDASCIDATVPATQIEPNALTTGFCLGVIDHHGYEVAVVDMTAAIGLGAGTPAPETPVIVVRFEGDAMLGFAIDAVRDIVRISLGDILAIPSLSHGETSLFRGMLTSPDGRQNLLLDAGSLRALPALATLARLRKPRLVLQRHDAVEVPQGRTTTKAVRSHPFLTYFAGVEHATALHQVTEILTYPSDVAPFELLGTGVLGLFTHRGQVAPLVCLGALIGRPFDVDPTTTRVLFVEDSGHAVGFVVESLRSIETATGQGSTPTKTSDKSEIFKSLVMLGLGDQRRMVSHLDLVAEIRNLYRHVAVALPSATIAEPELLAVSA